MQWTQSITKMDIRFQDLQLRIRHVLHQQTIEVLSMVPAPDLALRVYLEFADFLI
ncbi:hypothetical protein M8C21_002708, partial [Ambrosia artemisiifolia]